MLPFCWFFMALIKHYGMTFVNTHSIHIAKQRHDAQAVALNETAIAYCDFPDNW